MFPLLRKFLGMDRWGKGELLQRPLSLLSRTVLRGCLFRWDEYWSTVVLLDIC